MIYVKFGLVVLLMIAVLAAIVFSLAMQIARLFGWY